RQLRLRLLRLPVQSDENAAGKKPYFFRRLLIDLRRIESLRVIAYCPREPAGALGRLACRCQTKDHGHDSRCLSYISYISQSKSHVHTSAVKDSKSSNTITSTTTGR